MTMNSERPWLASADSQAGVTTKFRHAPHGKTWVFAKQCIWLWHSLSAGDARLLFPEYIGEGGVCERQSTQDEGENAVFTKWCFTQARCSSWLTSELQLGPTCHLLLVLPPSTTTGSLLTKDEPHFFLPAWWGTVCVELQSALNSAFWRLVVFSRQSCKTYGFLSQ